MAGKIRNSIFKDHNKVGIIYLIYKEISESILFEDIGRAIRRLLGYAVIIYF